MQFLLALLPLFLSSAMAQKYVVLNGFQDASCSGASINATSIESNKCYTIAEICRANSLRMEQCIALESDNTMIDNSFKYTCTSSGVKAAFFNGTTCEVSLAEMEIGSGTCLGGMKITCSDTASNTNPPPSPGSGSPSAAGTNGVALPGSSSVPAAKNSGLKTQLSIVGVVALFSLALL